MNFGIGSKVMANFGQYGRIDYHVDDIVGETKTLWKCRNFSFSKTSPNVVRGQSEWNPVCVEPYDEQKIQNIQRKAKIRKEFDQATHLLNRVGNDYEKMQSFIDWVADNLI